MATKAKEVYGECTVREFLWFLKEAVCPECNQQEFAAMLGMKKQNLGAALAGKIWHTGRPCINGEPGTTAKAMQKYADRLDVKVSVGQVCGTGNLDNPIRLIITAR